MDWKKIFAVVKPLMLLIWLLGGLYIGMSGVVRADLDREFEELFNMPVPEKGRSVEDSRSRTWASIQDERMENKEDAAHRWFGWIFDLPSFPFYILTGAAWGAVGSTIRLIRRATKPTTTITGTDVLVMPLFGSMVAVLLVCLSHIVPNALTVGSGGESVTLDQTAMLLICVFGGLFAESMFAKIEAMAKVLLQLNDGAPDQQ